MADVYLRRSRNPVVRTRTVQVADAGIMIDLDAADKVIGVEMLSVDTIEVDGKDIIAERDGLREKVEELGDQIGQAFLGDDW